jgi:hypothetical protein
VAVYQHAWIGISHELQPSFQIHVAIHSCHRVPELRPPSYLLQLERPYAYGGIPSNFRRAAPKFLLQMFTYDLHLAKDLLDFIFHSGILKLDPVGADLPIDLLSTFGVGIIGQFSAL